MTELLQRDNLRARELAVLDQQRRGLPATDQHELQRGSLGAACFECRDCSGKELQRIAWREVDPTRDRQQSTGFQVIEILAQRFDGVQVALGDRVEPRGRRTKSIEQAHLDQLEAIGVRHDEVARLADVHAHAGGTVRHARVVGEAMLHKVDDLRIDFDGIDLARPVIDRLQDVAARPRAEHQHARPFEQVIWQRRSEGIEIGKRLALPVVARERGRTVAVGEYAKLRRRLHDRVKAHSWGVAKRDQRALDDGDPSHRARSLRYHARVPDGERLAEVLIG